MCNNELDIQLIAWIKNNVFYCRNKNCMVKYPEDCNKCKDKPNKNI